jgi:hypothetical protein
MNPLVRRFSPSHVRNALFGYALVVSIAGCIAHGSSPAMQESSDGSEVVSQALVDSLGIMRDGSGTPWLRDVVESISPRQ